MPGWLNHGRGVWPALLLCVAALGGCKPGQDNAFKNDPMFSVPRSPNGEAMLSAPIPVVGIHHYGRGHHIGEFSVNGQACGNAGNPQGNSGSDTMCRVPLPAQWRPGIKMKVKWSVTNWKEDLSGLQPGNSGTWHEAEAEVERYLPSTGAVGVHFWPDHSIRLVPNGYGPPDEDTRPDQTPPLTELPVYEPGWYGLGGLRAAFKHEGKYGQDLQQFEANNRAYYTFLQRLYTSRGLTASQIQALLDKEREKEERGVRSGQLSYLSNLMEKQGMSYRAAFDLSEKFRHVPESELDAEIQRYLAARKR